MSRAPRWPPWTLLAVLVGVVAVTTLASLAPAAAAARAGAEEITPAIALPKVVTRGPGAGDVELHYALSAEAAADLGVLALGPGVGGGVESSTGTQDPADAHVREPGGVWQARSCGTRT